MINLKANYPSLPREGEILEDYFERASMKNIRKLPTGIVELSKLTELYNYLNLSVTSNFKSNIFHCKSGSQAIYSILLALQKQSLLTGIEEFTYSGFKWAANVLDYSMRIIECDEEGIKPDALERAINEGVRLIYLQPTIQNPTCIVMGKQRRLDIVDIVRNKDVILFEDDAYRFLHPDPPPSFIELIPEKTIHIYSLSKPFNSLIESCFIFLPENILTQLDDQLRLTGGFGSSLSKDLSFYLFKKSRLSDLIKKKQLKAIEIKDALKKQLKNLDYKSFPSSFHLWIKLHGQFGAKQITETLLKENIHINGSHEYSITENDQFIRIALSGEKKISVLSNAIRKVINLSND